MPPESVTGINYPWARFQERSNYGCDFGLNVWASHTGVTAHIGDVERDFDAMAAIGLDVVRWFVFTDGRGGIRWDSSGRPAGLADGFFDDMDSALGLAKQRGLRLCLVLFDYLWMNGNTVDGASYAPDPGLLATADGRAHLIGSVLDPLLARYGTGGSEAGLGTAIHSVDVINEPDWVTQGLEFRRQWFAPASSECRPFTLDELRAFVGDVAARVHRTTTRLVTLGGGRVRHGREWESEAYGLDFVQLHSYPDVQHPHRDVNLPCECKSLGLGKPVLIGECPAQGDRKGPVGDQPPPFSLTDYLDLAKSGGYLGAWPWSFQGTDDYGSVDASAMQTWIRAQRQVGQPRNR